MNMYNKLAFLTEKKKISNIESSKLDLLRKYRNNVAHPSKSNVIAKDARLVIELGIELTATIQQL